jgi:PKD domain
VNDRTFPYNVTVTVVDGSGQSAGTSFGVTVANVPPAVRINTPATGSNLAWKTTYTFKATITDAGTADAHTCTIAWGDGTSSTGSVSESGGTGTCNSSHAYGLTGNYTITVTVTDPSGGKATATSAITVTKTGGSVYSVLRYLSPAKAKAKAPAAKKMHVGKKHPAKKTKKSAHVTKKTKRLS